VRLGSGRPTESPIVEEDFVEIRVVVLARMDDDMVAEFVDFELSN
jgi:hypothetical protein